MRVFKIIMAIITLLLLFSVIVCGLSIDANGTDAIGLAFHKTIGIAAAVSGAITSSLVFVQKKKQNN